MPSVHIRQRLAWLALLCIGVDWSSIALAASDRCEAAMKFRAVSELAKQSTDYEAQIAQIRLALAREQRTALTAGDSEARAAAESEDAGLEGLLPALNDLGSKLATAVYLAGARDEMRDRRDSAALLGYIRLLAQDGLAAASTSIAATGDALSSTRRPGVAAALSKISDFLPRARDAFQACANPGAAAR
jgi:hypothetical protein